MKKTIFFTSLLILMIEILYGKIPQEISGATKDSSSTNVTVKNTESENQQKYKLKIPEGISTNNLEKAFGTCFNCEEIEQLITKKETKELKKLPFMVYKTINEITKYKKGRYEDVHKIVAKLSNGNINNNFESALRTGERICQVFYFSFLANSAQLVGTHRCLVERLNGDIAIFKFTGNRLFVTFKPYKESALAFVGRSYIPEHQQQRYDRENPDNKENDNFGNEVGYVFSIDKKLVLLSICQRGFTEPDSTFFSCVIIN
jgi:hypothetical protein